MADSPDPLFFAKSLQYYKRREVQEAIVRHAADREVAPRYGEGFGKRPDVLMNPQDVLEFAKRKATSFHASEERWESPLSIKTGASRKEQSDLRKGWDLVLDIDAPDWEISRLTAWLFIEALRAHGVRSITAKFSGNKGWHIGVPFESFPRTLLDADGKRDLLTKDLFPELPRAVAGYLLDFMSRTENGLITVDGDRILFGWDAARASGLSGLSTVRKEYTLVSFARLAGKEPQQLLEDFCPACDRSVGRESEQYALICDSCQYRTDKRYTKDEKGMLDDRERICPKCRYIMNFTLLSKRSCPHDPRAYQRRFRIGEVIQVDTVLLASRHLYRMAYSLHEKSGLASVVIDPDGILGFEKRAADPKTIAFGRTFLDVQACAPGDASDLSLKAWRWQAGVESAKQARYGNRGGAGAAGDGGGEFEEVTEMIGDEHFPPCIRNILAGLKDGKKRAMFALTNFLTVCGWPPDAIEKLLYEWNARNPEPLREVIIKGHMHQVRMKRERILPPNCEEYYQALGVCVPDEFCSRIKNPATYAIRHSRLGARARRRRPQGGDAPILVRLGGNGKKEKGPDPGDGEMSNEGVRRNGTMGDAEEVDRDKEES